MTTVEAWDYIKEKMGEVSEHLNDVFIHSDNSGSSINLTDYETIDNIFKCLEFKDEEMV